MTQTVVDLRQRVVEARKRMYDRAVKLAGQGADDCDDVDQREIDMLQAQENAEVARNELQQTQQSPPVGGGSQ